MDLYDVIALCNVFVLFQLDLFIYLRTALVKTIILQNYLGYGCARLASHLELFGPRGNHYIVILIIRQVGARSTIHLGYLVYFRWNHYYIAQYFRN